MRSRDEEDAGNSSWIVLRHSSLEGVGLLGTVLRDHGIHHRGLDLAVRGKISPHCVDSDAYMVSLKIQEVQSRSL